MTDTAPASAADGAAILALATSYIGKYHDGPDVPILAQFVGQTFPEFADYDKQATATMPWCGDFVGFVLAHFGIRPPPVIDGVGYFLAAHWTNFGTPVPVGQEQPGDVAIYTTKMSHVTFVAGGGYYVGGNQSDGVTRAQYRPPDMIRRPPAIAGTSKPAPVALPAAVTMPAPTGASASGKGSWYSWIPGDPVWGKPDPDDKPGSNALGVPDACQGISFFNHGTKGDWFLVTAPNGVTSIEQQTEIGPAPSTGRTIDISAAAAVRFGYTPDNFPTDAVFTWRPIDPPAAVASLSPQEQAKQFQKLRGQQPMVDQTTQTAPAPNPQPNLPAAPAADRAIPPGLSTFMQQEAQKVFTNSAQGLKGELEGVLKDGLDQLKAHPEVIAAGLKLAGQSAPGFGAAFANLFAQFGGAPNLAGGLGGLGLAAAKALPALGAVATGSPTLTLLGVGGALLIGGGAWAHVSSLLNTIKAKLAPPAQ